MENKVEDHNSQLIATIVVGESNIKSVASADSKEKNVDERLALFAGFLFAYPNFGPDGKLVDQQNLLTR